MTTDEPTTPTTEELVAAALEHLTAVCDRIADGLGDLLAHMTNNEENL